MNICVVPGVLKTLQLTVHEREWMKGIVLSAAYLEAYALGKLKDFFMVAGRKPFDEELEKLNPAFIRFSSGTTGDSKGVVLSHETIRARTESANDVARRSTSGQETP